MVKTALGCVAIFRKGDDTVFALDDACPHKKGPLSEGIVLGTTVTCPLHNRVISLETSQPQGADEGAVNACEIKVENGRILLDGTRFRARSAAETKGVIMAYLQPTEFATKLVDAGAAKVSCPPETRSFVLTWRGPFWRWWLPSPSRSMGRSARRS